MAESSFRITVLPRAEVPDELIALFKAEGTEVVRFQKNLCWLKGDSCFVCADSPENRRYLETMRETGSFAPAINRSEDLFRQLLERKAGQGAEGKIADTGTPFLHHRNVLVFTAGGRGDLPFIDLMRTAAPMNRGDLLIPMKYNTAALIRSNGSAEGEEAEEYARAVIETLEVEGGVSALCGVGECKETWEELPDSYEEGLRALLTAEQFHLTGPVFRYRALFLERLLGAIPAEQRRALRQEMLRQDPDLLRNEEMAETVRTYFENDLSLSTTARKLYVHRNTLMYRLEKIRKSTGLDLRQFSDACLFHLLLHLPEE